MKVCSLGVWDENIPGIFFDAKGVSNYARIQQKLMDTYPRGTRGRGRLEQNNHQCKKGREKQ